MVIKPKIWGSVKTFFKLGLQGMLYDHGTDHLLACDAQNNRIIKVNPNTGRLYPPFHFIILFSIIYNYYRRRNTFL